MQLKWLWVTLVNFLFYVIYAAAAFAIGFLALKFANRKIFPSIDLEQEIKKGNLSAAVFAAALLLFIAFIVSFGIRR